MILSFSKDRLGADGIAAQIRQHVGDTPVYLSIDIDVLDPAFAPGTGTLETGGWSSRELRSILQQLQGVHLIGKPTFSVYMTYTSWH